VESALAWSSEFAKIIRQAREKTGAEKYFRWINPLAIEALPIKLLQSWKT
jgi:hypothetical protein